MTRKLGKLQDFLFTDGRFQTTATVRPNFHTQPSGSLFFQIIKNVKVIVLFGLTFHDSGNVVQCD